MKKELFIRMFLCILALGFMACDDDEENGRVDFSALQGEWNIVNDDPNLQVDGSCQYYFYSMASGTGLIVQDSYLEEIHLETQMNYEVDEENHTIRIMYEYQIDDKVYPVSELYKVINLSGDDMKWINSEDPDGKVIHLRRMK